MLINTDVLFRFCSICLLLLSFQSSSALSACAAERRILPEQWRSNPVWSKDGFYVAVQSPPPEIESNIDRSGNISYSQREVIEPKSYVLNANDFSVICELKELTWPTWSPDGKFLAAVTSLEEHQPHRLAIYDAQSGARVNISEQVSEPSSFEWSPDSEHILLTQRKKVSIASVRNPLGVVCKTEIAERYYNCPVWSPDGKLVAACGSPDLDKVERTKIRIWNSKSGDSLFEIDSKFAVGKLSWSPDGSQFIYAEPGSLHILDAETMKSIQCLKTQDIEAVDFKFCPNQSLLAYQDCEFINFFGLNSLRELGKIEASKNGFFDFKFSPNGKHILISSSETIAICDTSSKQYLTHNTYPDAIGADWEPQGKFLVLRRNSLPPKYVQIDLPKTSRFESNVLTGGKEGPPAWSNYPSPGTLEECYEGFAKFLSPAQIKEFKHTPEKWLSKYGGGSFYTDSLMARFYNKWNFNELEKNFQKHGITDPRDVVGIMLTSYWRVLNAKPVGLEEQIRQKLLWWNREKRVYRENRLLPQRLLDATFKSYDGEVFSIAKSPSQIEVVAVGYADRALTLIRALNRLRNKYTQKELAITILTLDEAALDGKRSRLNESDSAEIVKTSFRDVRVAPASYLNWKEFRSFINGRMSSFPQTFFLSQNGIVVTRLNGFDLLDEDDYFMRLDKEMKFFLLNRRPQDTGR